MKKRWIAALCLIACMAYAKPRVYELWEYWSYPIGNGYMCANVFGRTDTERIQLTEKTLFSTGLYGLGGLISFA